MNRPFARSGHMVRNKLCWDANNFSGTFKTKESRADILYFAYVRAFSNLLQYPSVITYGHLTTVLQAFWGLVHPAEKFENGVFTPKMHHIFSVHTIRRRD